MNNISEAELAQTLAGLGFRQTQHPDQHRPTLLLRTRVDADVPGRTDLIKSRHVILTVCVDPAERTADTAVVDGRLGAPVTYMQMSCGGQIAETIDDVLSTIEAVTGLRIQHEHSSASGESS